MQGGQRRGPVEAAALKQLAINGQLKPTDMIWREGMPDWLPARQAKGLFPPQLQTQAPVATEPQAVASGNAVPPRPTVRPPRPGATPQRPKASQSAGTSTASQASPVRRPPAIVGVSASPYIVRAMDRWSGAFFKLTLPSRLGQKAVIKQCTDEGAKVLSMGVYMAYRTAEIGDIPYDGSTYEGHTMKDESVEQSTLWAYETAVPDGFEPASGETFVISMGHVFKCPDCRGQGRIKCQTCGGKVRWTTSNTFDNGYTEHVCSCGDGHQDCPRCTGYGGLLKVLRVATKYCFEETKTREYAGRLPQTLLMGSAGKNIYRHVAEFEQRAVAEAIDGFDADEFERLMTAVHSEFKSDVSEKVAGQMVNPDILHALIDGYFRDLPNPVTANKRLKEEVLPIRLKCEVTDVPVVGVKYQFKGRSYSLYVHGNNGEVWADGRQPAEFTWKLGVVVGLAVSAVVFFLVLGLVGGH